MPTPSQRRVALLALLAFVVTATPGCTRGPGLGAYASPKRSSPAAGLPAGVVNATAVPTAAPNDASARRNTTLSSCHGTKDGWQASGTASNPGGRKTRYTITVFFTTTRGTVIGSGQTATAVESRAEQPWTVTATFHAPPDTRCVLAGVG